MKLTRRVEMVSSSAKFLVLKGFEVQRKMGMLKSATMAKVRLSDGCCCWDDEFVGEHKVRDMDPVFHCGIGGRF